MGKTFWRSRALVGAAAAALTATGPALAQPRQWPSHEIVIYVGFAVGGYADSVARVLGDQLSKKLGQPVVIENMDGAGGNVAARQVQTSAPDGYTLLATTTALAINATLYRNKGFSTGGLVPIALPAVAPESLTASNGSKIKSLRDLPAATRSQKLYLATPGIGSGSQIAEAYFFEKLAKLPVTQIPFSGGGPAMQGLLSGDANLMAATAAAQIVSGIESRQIVGLAIASQKRDPAIPDVPTFAEQGYPNFLASSWVGFFAPPKTPSAIVDKLNATINAILQDPLVRKAFVRLGAEESAKSAAVAKADFDADVARWSTMVDSIGLSL
jgi:tripartite-type tricarboxylate transporter receptor subunit TctC